MGRNYIIKGLEFTRIFMPVNGEPRVEKRTAFYDGEEFWVYMRYIEISRAAQKAAPDRVQVFFDSVSARVEKRDENGNMVQYSELYPVREYV